MKFTDSDLRFLTTLSELTFCNPFLHRRLELEKEILGSAYSPEEETSWTRTVRTSKAERPNVLAINERAEKLAEKISEMRLVGFSFTAQLAELYEDLVTYVLYYRFFAYQKLMVPTGSTSLSSTSSIWNEFQHDYQELLGEYWDHSSTTRSAEHLFACLNQVRRAFQHIFEFILGDSSPIVQLRAAVWESIFTYDMKRYRRSLYHRMLEIPTLITGPSGTGKELVARSIALAQYLPFDSRQQQFIDLSQERFIPLNLTALSPTLIESELFGHRKGSFTGANADKAGWLERCSPQGAIFLDEIGELEQSIQVKLLRVVQNRVWCRLGETTERKFTSKLIAATNRNLQTEIDAGHFRLDLFYRLCADHIETPSLRQQLDDQPEAIVGFIELIAERIAGEEAESVTADVLSWIDQHLDPAYSWPGNVRELEQCVRNIMVRKHYQPRGQNIHEPYSDPSRRWLQQAESGELTSAELQRAYVTWVYYRIGSYDKTAQRVGLDRRTVKSWIDKNLLDQIEKSNPSEAS